MPRPCRALCVLQRRQTLLQPLGRHVGLFGLELHRGLHLHAVDDVRLLLLDDARAHAVHRVVEGALHRLELAERHDGGHQEGAVGILLVEALAVELLKGRRRRRRLLRRVELLELGAHGVEAVHKIGQVGVASRVGALGHAGLADGPEAGRGLFVSLAQRALHAGLGAVFGHGRLGVGQAVFERG